jgi:hypothetical protein
MNISPNLRNIVYIYQLTDERTEEYKVNEYMTLYSSIPRNIVEARPTTPAPDTCPYIPWLTDEYIDFLYSPYFNCLPGWGASKIGHINSK